MTDQQLVAIGLLVVGLGLFAIASAIEKAGKWIGEALWHPGWQTPPKWWDR